jgi:transcriptional regulator with XRE-family HTH domain
MSQEPRREQDDDASLARRLGEKLRKHREYLGMSQQYVAECTGIPRTAVSDIERGQRKVDAVELTKFARSLLTRKYGRLTGHDLAQLEDFAAFLAARRASQDEERPPGERS